MEIPPLLHMSLGALLDFVADKCGELPRLHNEEDAKQLLEMVKQKNEANKNMPMEIEGVIKLETIDEEIVLNIARYART